MATNRAEENKGREIALTNYIKEKHTAEECFGFVDGFDSRQIEIDELTKEVKSLTSLGIDYVNQINEFKKEVERMRNERESFIETMKAHRVNAIENQQQGIRIRYNSGVEETIDYLITTINH